MKVVLSGGGSGEQTKELDRLFSSLLDKSKPLLYIPIAVDTTKHPYPNCFAWLRSNFGKLGVSKYEMWTEKDLDKAKRRSPKIFSGIYIGGGNTSYLLKTLKEARVWDFLKKAIKEDVPIYGGSAGAIIFSKSIKPSLNFDKDWTGLKEFGGMNLLKDNYLFCHFISEREAKIKRIIIRERISSAIALSEKSGLFVTENSIEIIGQESGWFFDKKGNKKELKVGEKI